MLNVRFLVPVLAAAALALPAGASVAVYCTAGYSNCPDTDAAFQSAVTSDGYTYASTVDLTFSSSGLEDGGLEYLDSTTGLLFSSTSAFTIVSGDELKAASGAAVTVTVPTAFAGISLNVSVPTGAGNVWTYLDSGENYYAYVVSSGIPVDYLNSAPTAAWTATITPSGAPLIIDSFNAAGIGVGGSNPVSSTPEVGTLLLIGSGLISMRWMRRLPRKWFRTPQTV